MIIIVVDREFERFDALLGMHSWSEFLLEPTEEEAGNSSKVFYCTYHSAEVIRGAGAWVVVLMDVVLLIHSSLRRRQPIGWNRVEIEDHWFQGWRLDNE
jgi:hypothetical protein